MVFCPADFFSQDKTNLADHAEIWAFLFNFIFYSSGALARQTNLAQCLQQAPSYVEEATL